MVAASVLEAAVAVPADPSRLQATIPYADMADFLASVARPGLVTVSEEGRSHEGRAVYLVRLNRGGAKARFRALFYAQQHGNEVSGKDALLCLIQAIAQRPELLPGDLDLYLMPMVNPDGAQAGRRLNGAQKDLNRDHITLFQGETLALHQVARRIQPHLAVDCHEFTRDGEEWDARGWDCWPEITLDGLNVPWIPASLRDAALATVASAGPAMARSGFRFSRYLVGGMPPLEEMRPSTTELDDGRNSIGCMGALSFIIEAAVAREPGAANDLGRRATAYTRLLRHLLGTAGSRERIRRLCERARREALPPFLATNVFWANRDGVLRTMPVLERKTGRTLRIPTLNLMTDLVTKASVPTPRGYVVDAACAGPYRALLDRHGLSYEVLAAETTLPCERCRLLRVEKDPDPVYGRYPNRQIVARDAVAARAFAAGSLVVRLDQPLARCAIGVLEPTLLYGLYSYNEFNSLAQSDGTLPVWRLP
jgi:hypothetical protein